LINIAVNKIGTYALQSVIEQMTSESERGVIIKEVKEFSLILSMDLYGSHVIEKMLACFSQTNIDFLYNVLIENFVELANHCNGLCAIKKLIMHASSEVSIEKIKYILAENALILVQNPYGNYAIQTALEYWQNDEDIIPILTKIRGKYVTLSIQKYSSNVIEKCLERNRKTALVDFVDEVSKFNRAGGNYLM
jgi:hypothetical protein